MEIILIRHGETEYNCRRALHGWIDSELNEKGRVQVENIAEYLMEEKMDAIYSSPLKRALDTGNVIAKRCGNIPVNIVHELKEVHFGLFEGLTYDEICEKYSEEAKRWQFSDLNYCFPGGEGIPCLHNRVKSFMEDVAKSQYKKIAVISHEGPIKCILSYIMNSTADLFWKYKISNGSISRICIEDKYSYIISINENLKYKHE
jgi:alpha-ribazole phosphatase